MDDDLFERMKPNPKVARLAAQLKMGIAPLLDPQPIGGSIIFPVQVTMEHIRGFDWERFDLHEQQLADGRWQYTIVPRTPS